MRIETKLKCKYCGEKIILMKKINDNHLQHYQTFLQIYHISNIISYFQSAYSFK